MNDSFASRSRTSSLALALCGLTLLTAASARAAECPASSPDDKEERRALAKFWFNKADAAEGAGDNAEAARAYACSMKMVAHPNTAYNLARVAERADDLELALRSYKAYLSLKTDAPDKDDVSNRIKRLQDRIAAAKTAAEEKPIAEEKPVEEKPVVEEPPVVVERPLPPPERKPVRPQPVQVKRHAPEPPPPPTRLTEWIVGGVGAAALVTGIILNISARGKMDDCNKLANNNQLGSARTACNDARPRAYVSYGMFAAAGVAAVVDGALLLHLPPFGGTKDDTLSMGILPGGLSLTATGRF